VLPNGTEVGSKLTGILSATAAPAVATAAAILKEALEGAKKKTRE
jgi:Na+/H+ antiporter NhaC